MASACSSILARLVVASLTAVSAVGLLSVLDNPASAAAPTYYVSASGSDAGSGGAVAPWRTIQYAVTSAPAGSTISVSAGTFAPFVIAKSGMSIVGAGNSTVVTGVAGTANTIAINATNTSISTLAVTGCKPVEVPGNGYEWAGSANIAVSSAGSGSTISGVTITGSPAYTSQGLDFGCFGVAVRQANTVTVQNSTISQSGYGVFIYQGGSGTTVSNNSIHDNNLMIRNTMNANDDFGAVAVGVGDTHPTTPITVSGNTIFNNQASSHDYITDGGAYELYGASNVTYTGNTTYNNESIMETGSGPGNPCANIVYQNNVDSGASTASPLARVGGIMIRSALNSVFRNNTFTNIGTYEVLDIEPQGGDTTVADGLQILDNTFTQATGFIYAFGYNPAGHNFTISGNTYMLPPTVAYAKDWNGKYLLTEAALYAATGLSAPAAAATYRVSASGSDAGSGSALAPWRTIQHAVSYAPAGSTISVSAGTFAPFVVAKSGMSIVGAGNSTVVPGLAGTANTIAINGANTSISGLSVTGCKPAELAHNDYELSGSANIAVSATGSGSTISAVTITGSPAVNSQGLKFGCFGVAMRQAGKVTVQNSTISRTGYGVFIYQGGSGTTVSKNSIHDNNLMIRNTTNVDGDFGGIGVGINAARPSAPITVSGNTIFNNSAASHDYGTVGGAYQLFSSSNVVFSANTTYNNQSILQAAAGTPCVNIIYQNNNDSGASTASPLAHVSGILIRSAGASVFKHNTFTNIGTLSVIDIEPQGTDTSQANGLQVIGNTFTQTTGFIYAFSYNPAGHKFSVTGNIYHVPATLAYAKTWTGKYLMTAAAMNALGLG